MVIYIFHFELVFLYNINESNLRQLSQFTTDIVTLGAQNLVLMEQSLGDAGIGWRIRRLLHWSAGSRQVAGWLADTRTLQQPRHMALEVWCFRCTGECRLYLVSVVQPGTLWTGWLLGESEREGLVMKVVQFYHPGVFSRGKDVGGLVER